MNNSIILIITVRAILILITPISFTIILSLFSGSLLADKRQTIRFYKLNSKDQAQRILIREKTAKSAGCHNFVGKKRIFRLTQIGFKYCSVYSKKNCEAGTEINGLWDKSNLSEELTEGGEWLFNKDNPKGTLMRSWQCL